MGHVSSIGREELLDGFGGVERFDFSRSNMSTDSRIEVVQKVASICFQSDQPVGSSGLYNKLKAESLGLPSSSFEFIPILLTGEKLLEIEDGFIRLCVLDKRMFQTPNVIRYGTMVTNSKGEPYQLTNLRALLHDVEMMNGSLEDDEKIDPSVGYFNTDQDEIDTIAANFFVFHSEVDIVTARQFMRHRVSWQELSRRYVPGKKVPFSIFLSEDVLLSSAKLQITTTKSVNAKELAQMCIDMYDALIADGVHPQSARRVIPQGAMTKVWSAWFAPSLSDMIALRSAGKAQKEIRSLAKAMHGLAPVHTPS